MATINGQVRYELSTNPLWDMPEMTEVEFEVSILSAEKLAIVQETADDLGCSIEQAYKELKDLNEI